MTEGLRTLIALACAAGVFVGAASFDVSRYRDVTAMPPRATASGAAALRDRALARFVSGWLGKPSRDEQGSDVFRFAPLFVFQRPESEASLAAHVFGPPDAPVVYFSESTALLHGDPYQQFVYCWGYDDHSRASDDSASSAGARFQGVRMTLDGRGFPAVWEILGDSSGARLLYISTALEKAAAAQWKTPLAGARHVARAATDGASHVVIVRAIETGGTPLGPFVYLQAGTHDVASVICRCMPAQVDAVDETFDYVLEPLPDDFPQKPFLDERDQPDWLERVLRWPSSW